MVRAGGQEIPLRRTYSDVRPGEYVALINSFGVLEVARAEKSAAEGLGLGRGAPVVVSRRSRKPVPAVASCTQHESVEKQTDPCIVRSLVPALSWAAR